MPSIVTACIEKFVCCFLMHSELKLTNYNRYSSCGPSIISLIYLKCLVAVLLDLFVLSIYLFALFKLKNKIICHVTLPVTKHLLAASKKNALNWFSETDAECIVYTNEPCQRWLLKSLHKVFTSQHRGRKGNGVVFTTTLIA